MNTFDIIVIVIICATFISGFWKGLIRQVFSLGGVVLGYIFARKYYEVFSHYMPVAADDLKKMASFTAIFISIIVAVSLVGWVIGRLVKNADLDWVNRVTGGVLGFLKGSLIIVVITVLLLAFLPADNSLLTGSTTLPYAIKATEMLSAAIPEDIRTKYYEKAQDIASRWKLKERRKSSSEDRKQETQNTE